MTVATPQRRQTTTVGSVRATLQLWRLLRRRNAGHSDPQGLTEGLAILAFAVSTAVLLLVLGGFMAFLARSQAPGADPDTAFYVLLAGIASGLLLVPILTLGGAAARLAMARRDERLAALRLAGATTGQVGLLTVLDAGRQALLGALAGAAAVLGLIPLVLPLRFQGQGFTYGDLVAPAWVFAATAAVVILVALVAAAASLAKVAITPLGVAARHTPRPLHWTRVGPVVAFAVAFAVLIESGRGEIVVLAVLVVGGLAMINLVGPWVLGLVGRLSARRARTVATLVAARRIIDDPKGAWRSVGGVALCTFIAGLAAAIAMVDPGPTPDGTQDPLYADLLTGGFLTLAIAGLLAAVSTGVMQAGRIIDQRGQYRALDLAGTDMQVLHAARLRQTAIPLVAAVAIATGGALVFMLPGLGFSLLTSLPVLLQFLLSVVGVCALVLAGTLASRPVVRTVLG